MKNFPIQNILMLFLFMWLVAFSFSIESPKRDRFTQTKLKLEKKISEKHLNNYLRHMMLKNNELLNNQFVFVDHDDFSIDPEDLNYNTMQIDENDDNEFRARIFAYKWAKLNLKNNSEAVKPYSVKEALENAHNWKSYIVLLLGNGTNILKKVCFPSNLQDNFAIVVKFDQLCSDKINKLYKYQIMEEESSGDSIKENIKNHNVKKNVKLNPNKKNEKSISLKDSKIGHKKIVSKGKKIKPTSAESKNLDKFDANIKNNLDHKDKNNNLDKILPLAENNNKETKVKSTDAQIRITKKNKEIPDLDKKFSVINNSINDKEIMKTEIVLGHRTENSFQDDNENEVNIHQSHFNPLNQEDDEYTDIEDSINTKQEVNLRETIKSSHLLNKNSVVENIKEQRLKNKIKEKKIHKNIDIDSIDIEDQNLKS